MCSAFRITASRRPATARRSPWRWATTSNRWRRTAGRTSSTPVSDRPVASRALVALAFATLATLPARAGLFDDEEARRRIELLRQELSQQGRDNEARIARLEESVRNIGVVELLRQLDQLNAELARLRGQLEVLGNENQQIQKRQRDFYLDLDSRMKRLEGGGSGASGAAAPAATTPATAPSASSSPESRANEPGPVAPQLPKVSTR